MLNHWHWLRLGSDNLLPSLKPHSHILYRLGNAIRWQSLSVGKPWRNILSFFTITSSIKCHKAANMRESKYGDVLMGMFATLFNKVNYEQVSKWATSFVGQLLCAKCCFLGSFSGALTAAYCKDSLPLPLSLDGSLASYLHIFVLFSFKNTPLYTLELRSNITGGSGVLGTEGPFLKQALNLFLH